VQTVMHEACSREDVVRQPVRQRERSVSYFDRSLAVYGQDGDRARDAGRQCAGCLHEQVVVHLPPLSAPPAGARAGELLGPLVTSRTGAELTRWAHGGSERRAERPDRCGGTQTNRRVPA
jgi:hypothetical protein